MSTDLKSKLEKLSFKQLKELDEQYGDYDMCPFSGYYWLQKVKKYNPGSLGSGFYDRKVLEYIKDHPEEYPFLDRWAMENKADYIDLIVADETTGQALLELYFCFKNDETQLGINVRDLFWLILPYPDEIFEEGEVAAYHRAKESKFIFETIEVIERQILDRIEEIAPDFALS